MPSRRVLAGYVQKAMELNEAGAKAPARPKLRARKPAVPEDLGDALKKNRMAADAFESFSPSHQREYVEWITEAKRESTRQRRLETAIGWMAEGKPRNWKYMK